MHIYTYSSPKGYISRVKGMYVYVLQCTKTLQHDCNVYNRFVQGILYSIVHAMYIANNTNCSSASPPHTIT